MCLESYPIKWVPLPVRAILIEATGEKRVVAIPRPLYDKVVATVKTAKMTKLEELKERYKELCDEEYDLQCDSSGHVTSALRDAIKMVAREIEELEGIDE